jgi:hypothetical protein
MLGLVNVDGEPWRPGGLLCLLFAALGCNPVVYSPPPRFLPLESVATRRPGEFGLQAEGAVNAQTFGPALLSGTVRVRSGLNEEIEAAGELTVANVTNEGAIDQPSNIYAGRIGGRFRLEPWLAVGAGLGGGGSIAGGFIGPDASVQVAYENPYLVPFASVRAGMSAPFAVNAVDVSTQNAGPGSDVLAPELSALWGGAGGLKLPIGPRDAEDAAILAGIQLVQLLDDDSEDVFFGLGVAVEAILR